MIIVIIVIIIVLTMISFILKWSWLQRTRSILFGLWLRFWAVVEIVIEQRAQHPLIPHTVACHLLEIRVTSASLVIRIAPLTISTRKIDRQMSGKRVQIANNDTLQPGVDARVYRSFQPLPFTDRSNPSAVYRSFQPLGDLPIDPTPVSRTWRWSGPWHVIWSILFKNQVIIIIILRHLRIKIWSLLR